MADPFESNASVAPDEIGALRIILHLPRGDNGNGIRGEYLFEVLAGGEKVKVREGNLAPHLSASEQTAVKNFMLAMKAKADASLPQGD